MGFNVILEDEEGTALDQLDDPDGLLKGILPGYEEKSFPQLRFVDPYGDTIFNRPQMEAFLEEWQRLAAKAQSSDAQELHRRVTTLARRCNDEVHLYLKFRGE